MSLTSTQLCSSDPYPSQSTRYLDWPSCRQDIRMSVTVYAGSPSISNGVYSTSGPGTTGFRLETWKVGWILKCLGKLRTYLTGLIHFIFYFCILDLCTFAQAFSSLKVLKSPAWITRLPDNTGVPCCSDGLQTASEYPWLVRVAGGCSQSSTPLCSRSTGTAAAGMESV